MSIAVLDANAYFVGHNLMHPCGCPPIPPRGQSGTVLLASCERHCDHRLPLDRRFHRHEAKYRDKPERHLSRQTGRRRQRGYDLIWVEHDLMDPRTVSRRTMRDKVSEYMRTVMKAEPVDPSLVEFEDEVCM